jgi:hypothetical protein
MLFKWVTLLRRLKGLNIKQDRRPHRQRLIDTMHPNKEQHKQKQQAIKDIQD